MGGGVGRAPQTCLVILLPTLRLEATIGQEPEEVISVVVHLGVTYDDEKLQTDQIHFYHSFPSMKDECNCDVIS